MLEIHHRNLLVERISSNFALVTIVRHRVVYPLFEFADNLVPEIRFHHNCSTAIIVSDRWIRLTLEAVLKVDTDLFVGTRISFFFAFIYWNRAETILLEFHFRFILDILYDIFFV